MSFPISWTDLTSDSSARPIPLEQRGGDVYFIIHHAYNLLVQDSIALSKPGGREVSMTFAIGPVAPGVKSPIYCVNVVPLDRRPWTTSSELDAASLTAEVSNIDLISPYPVAAAAKELLAQIAAEMHTVYGMPLDRVHVLSHQEVYARGYGSYATACPGGDLQAALDWIVARAIQISTSPTKEKDTMDYKYMWDGKRYALIHPLALKDGSIVTTDPALASSFSVLVNDGPVKWSEAELTAEIKFAKQLYDIAKAERATIDVGNITVPSADQTALLKALADLTAAVKDLPRAIDAYEKLPGN